MSWTKLSPPNTNTRYSALTAAAPAVDVDVEGTKISLLEHQRRTVAAMIDVEKCAASGKYTAAILRDLLGSGKTYCMVALLASGRAPPLTQIGQCGAAAVRRKYAKVFRTNVIFVASGVMAAWEGVLALTSRRVFMLRDIRDLRRLYAEYTAGTMAYDDILVKNGVVTADLALPEFVGGPLEFGNIRSILTIFGVVFANVCFMRVILDDFDTLNIAPAAKIIPAWFTWYVSSTTSSSFSGDADRITYANIYDELDMSRVLYVDQLMDITGSSCTLPVVRSHPDYVVESTAMTPVHFWKYYHVNPHASAIAALASAGYSGLAEMLNADALATAAESVGNAGLGVGGIFKKVLGADHAAYMLAGSRGTYCNWALDYCGGLGPRGELALFRKHEALRNNCLSAGPRETLTRMLTYRDDAAIGTIKVVGVEAAGERAARGLKITRVRERLQEGECPIMCVPLADCRAIFMLDCCQTIISDEAVNAACLKVQRAGASRITGECPMCRGKLSEDLIIAIDPVNIDDIIEERVDAAPKTAAAEVDAADTATEDTDDVAAPVSALAGKESIKYKSFVAISSGKADELPREPFYPELRGLMVGTTSRGSAPESEKKLLYIAKYEETFRSLIANLTEGKRRFEVMRGLRVHKNEIVRRYWLPNSDPESLQIILITDAAHCAGVNLQNTTDVIMAHGMDDDPHVRSQFIARAARYGRRYDLHVHVLLYNEERF